MPAPASGSSSAPIATAREGSGSGRCVFRSLKISAVAYGEDDQMMRSRGNDRVSRTSLDWMAVMERVSGAGSLASSFAGTCLSASRSS